MKWEGGDQPWGPGPPAPRGIHEAEERAQCLLLREEGPYAQWGERKGGSVAT